MRKRLTMSVILLGLVSAYYIWTPSSAGACRCGPYRPIEERVRDALQYKDVIFAGIVIRIGEEVKVARNGSQDELKLTAYYFTVTEAWKGVDQNQMIIYSLSPGPLYACGAPFELGGSYLIHANRYEVPGKLFSSLVGPSTCTLTTELSSDHAQDQLKFLGTKRIPSDTPGMPTTGMGNAQPEFVLVIVLCALSLGLVLRHRLAS